MSSRANIEAGLELPPLRKGPITRQRLVEWCAAENDYYPLHYDERMAEQMKLPGTPIQGTYRLAMLGQMIDAWLGAEGRLERISASYRGIDLEGETLTARGRVLSCEAVGDGARRVRLELWVENVRGERHTLGEAIATVR
jgi:acyl dehydratase